MKAVSSVSLDSLTTRPLGWQVTQRIEFVVQQVIHSHRGRANEEIADELVRRLRGLGVVPVPKAVERIAENIAALPPVTARPSAA